MPIFVEFEFSSPNAQKIVDFLKELVPLEDSNVRMGVANITLTEEHEETALDILRDMGVDAEDIYVDAYEDAGSDISYGEISDDELVTKPVSGLTPKIGEKVD